MRREPLGDDGLRDRGRLYRAAVVITRAFLITLAGPFVSVWRSLRDVARDPQTQNILTATGLLLLSGTLLFHWLEDFRWLDSLYFSFITLATIGYGDFSPATDAGKVATILYSIAGLGILAALISAIASHRPARPRQSARSRPSPDGNCETTE